MSNIFWSDTHVQIQSIHIKHALGHLSAIHVLCWKLYKYIWKFEISVSICFYSRLIWQQWIFNSQYMCNLLLIQYSGSYTTYFSSTTVECNPYIKSAITNIQYAEWRCYLPQRPEIIVLLPYMHICVGILIQFKIFSSQPWYYS